MCKVRRTNAIRERAVLNQYQDADPSTKITWLYGLYQKYQADIDVLVENDRGWYKKNVATVGRCNRICSEGSVATFLKALLQDSKKFLQRNYRCNKCK